jgi:hypothetical protein
MMSKYIALIFSSIALAGCCLSPNGCYAPLPGAPIAWDGLGTAPTETETTGATEDRPRKTARAKKQIIVGPIGAASAEPKVKLTGREAFLQQEAADRLDEERLTKKLKICSDCLPARTSNDVSGRSAR